MKWSELGRVCGRGRFMVPGVEDLRDVEAIHAALVLVLKRGTVRRTWLRHAPILRASGAWRSYLDDSALGRAYGYALGAGNCRRTFEVLRAPASERILPFATWQSLRDGPHACHRELHGRSARTSDRLWQAFMPPLGYDCTCCAGVISAPRARRRGAPKLDLSAEDLASLAPPGWAGAPPPVDGLDDGPARAAIEKAQAMLDAAGLNWPQSAGVTAGARVHPS